MTYLSEVCEKLKSSVLNDITYQKEKIRLSPGWIISPYFAKKKNMVTFTYNSTILFTNIMHDGRLRIPAKNRRRISPSEFFFYHFFFKVSFLQHEASFPSQGTTSSSLIFTARSDLGPSIKDVGIFLAVFDTPLPHVGILTLIYLTSTF